MDIEDNEGKLRTVLEYHEASKHYFKRTAEGPGYLDWGNQPNPFRRYLGTQLAPLEKVVTEGAPQPLYDSIFMSDTISPAVLNAHSVSQLFYDSLALSAWKSAGRSRWALRVNPSSGNLHPTEGYLICGAIDGLCVEPMVSHYAPKEHGLEKLVTFEDSLWKAVSRGLSENSFFIVLTSIHWREAWKYGTRAYRYCQLDIGHAIGALSFAALGLGWQARVIDELSSEVLSLLVGTFRDNAIEAEEAEVLIAITPGTTQSIHLDVAQDVFSDFATLDWQGEPNRLSESHRDWGIADVIAAVKKPFWGGYDIDSFNAFTFDSLQCRDVPLRKIIHQRRSAQAMDGKTAMSKDVFFHLLQKLVGVKPLLALPWKSQIHLAIFVHRVKGLAPGLYVLIRGSEDKKVLQQAYDSTHLWEQPEGCPEGLDLYCLIKAHAQTAAAQVACNQKISGEGCFSLGMISKFEEPLTNYGPEFYPRLYWEAGLIGQVLYLEAEAAGLRGTGMGCYFDEPMHKVLGLEGVQYQDLYHFTVGGAIEDTRIMTHEPYIVGSSFL